MQDTVSKPAAVATARKNARRLGPQVVVGRRRRPSGASGRHGDHASRCRHRRPRLHHAVGDCLGIGAVLTTLRESIKTATESFKADGYLPR